MSSTETVITTAGDTVDLIAYRRFGAHGAEVSIYDANPDLVDYGPILPAGLTVTIPVPGVADRTSTSNRLWA